MEPALKQRLIGAMVLVALAVIFLPMLIKGPAPESGVSDVLLDLPNAPKGDYETRELPLVTPGATPAGGAVGMGSGAEGSQTLPTVDTTQTAAPAEGGLMPAPTAGGDYAVTFGSYASTADAERVIGALRAAQLTGYQEALSRGGRTLYRVLIGPYATQPEAESARLQAARVRNDVAAKVIVLDAEAATPAKPAAEATASVSQPAPVASAPVSKPAALPESKPVATTKPAVTPKPVEPVKPVASKAAEAPKPAPTIKPAASNVGFAVQLGAFSNAAEATKLRDRARAAGFSAFVEPVRTDKGTLSRVRVGPVADRAEADRLKALVSAKLGVNGFVKSHP